MKLSPHFSDTELRVVDASIEAIAAATYLCNEVLEQIREHFGRPLVITSGRRSIEKNKETGGVKNSQHQFKDGDAAVDFIVVGVPLKKVYDWIRLESKLPVDQVILEKDKKLLIDACVHVSTNHKKTPRRMALQGQTHGTGSYTHDTFNV